MSFEHLIIGLLVTGAITGLLMAVLQLMVTSEKYSQYRIRTPDMQRIPLHRMVINIGLNMTFSVCIFIFALYHLKDFLVYEGAVAGVTVFGEALAVLLFYDFMYYFFHRTMHHRDLMKFIHGVHHRARFPTATQSLLLHPAENLGGLGLLLGSAMIIGPISTISLLVVIFLHSVINVLVHANMILPHPIFKLTNYWALKHDYHHGKHLNKNYASIFPFWDMMFDTYK